jgi:HME family heavy-metal exporter
VFRQADFIETSIRNVEQVLMEAGLVVAIVLFAFLLNWRTTLISLTAIPVSILATATIFYFAGLSINTMTLGGLAIALGELVDDAVVDVENIFRRLRENRALEDPRPVFDVIVSASQEAGPASSMRRRLSCWCSCRCSRCRGSRAACSRRWARPTLSRFSPASWSRSP